MQFSGCMELKVRQAYNYSHGQKSWDTFAFLGRFPIHTGPTPPLIPQTILDACIQNFFFRVSTLYRVGGGRTTRKFRKRCTVLRGNGEITEKYEYCGSVPRTFVQDCRQKAGYAPNSNLTRSVLSQRCEVNCCSIVQCVELLRLVSSSPGSQVVIVECHDTFSFYSRFVPQLGVVPVTQ